MFPSLPFATRQPNLIRLSTLGLTSPMAGSLQLATTTKAKLKFSPVLTNKRG